MNETTTTQIMAIILVPMAIWWISLGICTLKDTVYSRRTLKQSNSATQFSSGDLPRWPSWSELRRDPSLLFPVAVAGLLHGAGAVLFWPAFAMARFGRSKRNQIAD